MDMPAPIHLNTEQCRYVAERALRSSGLNIDPRKSDFIHFRVSKRLKALNLQSFDDYIAVLERDANGTETHHLIEALTTHTTSFFREKHQYDWLETEGLAQLSSRRKDSATPLTVWSAACSTGAELWSAGMVLSDAQRGASNPRNFVLVGTDISRRILKTAQHATYAETEIHGLSPAFLNRYMMQSRQRFGTSNQHFFRVVPELRAKARFEEMNLSKLDAARRFTPDIVFLRNVLIYFDEMMQRVVLDGVISRLSPGVILFTGHSEAVPPRSDLRALGPSIYEKA